MTETKHTPGPWRYFKQGDGTRFHVTARPPTKPGNRWDDFATVDVNHEADARLIAAAPEMLEALRAALSWLTLPGGADLKPHDIESARGVLRAAIAKAGGR